MEITSGAPNISLGSAGMDGFGGGFGMMFLAFLAIMGMGGGGFFGGNRVPNNVATTDTVNQAVQFSSLQDQNRDILTQISSSQANVMQYVGDHYSELQRDIAANAVTLANVQAHQSECCCQIRQEIAALNLENEKRFNALSSKMDQNTIQQLRDQVFAQSQQMQDMRAEMRSFGTIKYPNGFTYNAGPSPFCNGGFGGFINA